MHETNVLCFILLLFFCCVLLCLCCVFIPKNAMKPFSSCKKNWSSCSYKLPSPEKVQKMLTHLKTRPKPFFESTGIAFSRDRASTQGCDTLPNVAQAHVFALQTKLTEIFCGTSMPVCSQREYSYLETYMCICFYIFIRIFLSHWTYLYPRVCRSSRLRTME